MQAEPANPAASFRLVEVASQIGEYRTAITALERILLIHPNLANIKLELGVLYLRAGSAGLADRYIRDALDDPSAPAEVKARAQGYLNSANALLSPWSFSASAFLGIRYETNATAATDNDFVDLTVGSRPLNPDDQGKADGSVVAAANGSVSYDFGYQSGHKLVTNFGYYGAKYFHETDQNLDALSVDIGPAIQLGDGEGQSFVRPYLSGSFIFKGGEYYDQIFGAGLYWQTPVSPTVIASIDSIVSYQNFFDTEDDPLNDDRDGALIAITPSMRWLIAPDLFLTASLAGVWAGAEVDYNAYWQIRGEVSLTKAYTSFFGVGFPDWTTTASVSLHERVYDEPDPVVSLTDSQEDQRLDLTLSTRAPFAQRFAAVLELQYTKNWSNYDIDEYDNFSAMLAVSATY